MSKIFRDGYAESFKGWPQSKGRSTYPYGTWPARCASCARHTPGSCQPARGQGCAPQAPGHRPWGASPVHFTDHRGEDQDGEPNHNRRSIGTMPPTAETKFSARASPTQMSNSSYGRFHSQHDCLTGISPHESRKQSTSACDGRLPEMNCWRLTNCPRSVTPLATGEHAKSLCHNRSRIR